MIHTAIIDDGVNEHLHSIGPLHHNIEITPALSVQKRIGYNNLAPSHGTTCAAIIKKYAPSASLLSIKILNEKNKGVQDQLTHALRWCLDNNIKLVNLSLGSIHYKDFDELKPIVREAYKHGIIIIAACHNQDIYTCPASFSQVIGVKCDKDINNKITPKKRLKEGEYIFNSYPIDGIDFTACGCHFLTDTKGAIEKTPFSNSFAAPFITALVHNIMESTPGIVFEKIKDKLREKANNTNKAKLQSPSYMYDIDWIDNAVTFYMNNEITNNLKYQQYSLKAKNVISINCQTLNEGLNNITSWISSNKTVTSKITTIIVIKGSGLKHLNNDKGIFIDCVSQYKKNMVWIDDQMNDDPPIFNNKEGIKIWHPGVYKYYKTENTPDEQITVPIVTVYDMTKSRRYIHFLIHLEKAFRENGYFAIASVDTSMGVLEGIEYASLQEDQNEKTAVNIDRIYTLIKRYRPDIILAGISEQNKSNDYFLKLERTLEIDIKIILCDTNNIQPLIIDNGYSKYIVVSTKKEFINKIDSDIPVFQYPEDSDLSKIYECINDFFINEGLISEEIQYQKKRNK